VRRHAEADCGGCRSFAPPLVAVLGPETFVALYASAGVLSSLGGQAHKLVTHCTLPSLGASGALMFLVSCTAQLWPSAAFGVVLLPGVTFQAQHALMGVVCLDLLGLLLRWRALDHAAHLAGTALGVLLVNGGGFALVAAAQAAVLQEWRRLRRRS
jgi:membrane associated rhomboid family serine protease